MPASGVLRVAAIALPVWLVAAAQQSGTFVNEQYELVKIADGTYSFIAPESDSGVVQSNCSVIIGEDSVLIVDTGQFPSLAARMVADVKKLTAKPVRFIVNTHWHFDHMWGNAAFRDAYPGVSIISTEFTRKMFEQEAPPLVLTLNEDNAKQVKQYRELADAGKFKDGRPLTPYLLRSVRRLADTLEHLAPDFANVVNVAPTIGFEKELTIDLGKRIVKVMWLGRANTGGDAVVWVPDNKLLIAGDTVVMPTPFAFGSYLSEWPVTLAKMLELKPAIIIPGHGPVQRDDSYIRTLMEMFQTLFAEVKAGVAKGESEADIRKHVTLEEFRKRIAGDDGVRDQGFRGAFLRPGIDRAYQEATGTLKPESAH